MKKAFMAALTLCVVNPLMAKMDCIELAEMAETTMSARQQGVDMADWLKVVSEQGAAAAILKRWTIEAYESPLMSVEENKKTAISEFKAKQLVFCLKNTDG